VDEALLQAILGKAVSLKTIDFDYRNF